jgi:hypothetical protein
LFWCYKFLEVLNNNAELISLLEDLTDTSNCDSKNLNEQINELNNAKIQLVEAKDMDAVTTGMHFASWLPIFEN